MSEETDQEIVIKGIGGAPGICIGKTYIVDRGLINIVEKYSIDQNQLQNEINRFKSAIKKSREELRSVIENIPEEYKQNANIIETHIALLKDKLIYKKTIETIKNELINAEWSLKKTVENIRAVFQNMTDPYFKERGNDIIHISDLVLRNLVGDEKLNITQINKKAILIAHNLSPAETSQIKLDRIMGFVTEIGGKASHTGIVAQALNIPAVLGIDNITKLIKNDEIIIIDGASGIVVINPSEQTIIDYEEKKYKFTEFRSVITKNCHLPAETYDGVLLPVLGNLELPDEIDSVIENGADGIGLYRTEFQYLNRETLPNEEELFNQYKIVVEKLNSKPVTIRTLDANGDKALGTNKNYFEMNPALGLRAIRYCLKNPDVFSTQLRAILRVSAFGNVRVLFPMISNFDEVLEVKKLLYETASGLEKEGIDFNPKIKVGVMLEVPSAVVMADVIADEVDFFSIGTNDLIQYSFAIDRENKHVAHLYSPLHPAIIRLIKQITDISREKDVKTYMCGEMANTPIHLPILLGLGLDEISMNSYSIPIVKSIIRLLSVEDATQFTKEILKQSTVSAIKNLLYDTYGNIISEQTYI